MSFTISAGRLASVSSAGDSIAVNGVCVTVERVSGEDLTFTAVGETLKRTTLASLELGCRVNLERAATPTTALGGHIVQGHVDGVATVQSFERIGKDRLLAIRLPPDVARFAVEKGSITVDGVSLTIVDVDGDGVVTITIVPYTIENTVMGGYRPGTNVNVEADIIGKYVMEFLTRTRSVTSSGVGRAPNKTEEV